MGAAGTAQLPTSLVYGVICKAAWTIAFCTLSDVMLSMILFEICLLKFYSAFGVDRCNLSGLLSANVARQEVAIAWPICICCLEKLTSFTNRA